MHISGHFIKAKLFLALALIVIIIGILAVFLLPNSGRVSERYFEQEDLLPQTGAEQEQRYSIFGNLINLTSEGAYLEREGEQRYFPSSRPIPLYQNSNPEPFPISNHSLYPNIRAEISYTFPVNGKPYIERILVFP